MVVTGIGVGLAETGKDSVVGVGVVPEAGNGVGVGTSIKVKGVGVGNTKGRSPKYRSIGLMLGVPCKGNGKVNWAIRLLFK